MISNKKVEFIYIAGLLTPRGIKSTNPAIEYLLNVRDLARIGLELLREGFAPFCPALDFLYFMLLREDERITEPMIKRFSKDWLRRCDAILMTPGWEKSTGSIAEKLVAEGLGLPVFYTVNEIIKYNEKITYKDETEERKDKGIFY
jgi:hypothetical protein